MSSSEIPTSLFRYPGGKTRQAAAIAEYFKGAVAYCEPFVGAGSVLLAVLRHCPSVRKVWLNDADMGICAIWSSIRDRPDELMEAIQRLEPSVEEFRRVWKGDDPKTRLVQRAAERIASHQWSYSGLGPRAGGPIGGWYQRSKWGVGCRWNPDAICEKVRAINIALNRLDLVVVTSQDGTKVADIAALDGHWLYVDPPYVAEGENLYTGHMSEEEHTKLAHVLRNAWNPWVLSYDDHPLVRRLYGDCKIEEVGVTYTIDTRKTRKNKEIRIIGV